LAAVTSTVSTTTAAVAAATGSAAASAVRSLVDADPTSIEFLVVHGLHSGIGLGVLRIADEAKASATTSIAVLNHDGFFDCTELLELLTESLVVGMPCEASNEELRHGE
jgi:imidazolonepropionase-like amidohydrolase